MKRSWLLAVIILLITACTSSGINPIIEVSSISISPASLTLFIGEKEHLIASIYPSDATNKEIRWESDNSEVAIVDDQGFVAAFKEGSAIIIATSLANGIRATCHISVLPKHIAVESVNLDKSELSLRTGDVAVLTLTILPNDATNQMVNWESSDTNIVTIVNGQITGVNSGQANIIASVEGKSAVCSVNVRNRVIPDGGADIGLSVYWAKCNLGAASPEDYGDCYSWGEIETKSYYEWSNYRYYSGGSDVLITKYCPQDKKESWGGAGEPDNKTILGKEDDVAFQKLGGNWRIPTIEEIGELLNTQYDDNYEWTWVVFGDIDNSGRVVCGWTIRYKKNDNSITIPAASVTYTSGNAGATYFWGCLWSSSLCKQYPKMAYYLYLNVQSDYSMSPFVIEKCNREVGLSIRPVSE